MDKIEISVDVITGEVTKKVSQFTSEELAFSTSITTNAATKKEAETAAKQSALSKLSALGLTEAEIKALTGN